MGLYFYYVVNISRMTQSIRALSTAAADVNQPEEETRTKESTSVLHPEKGTVSYENIQNQYPLTCDLWSHIITETLQETLF